MNNNQRFFVTLIMSHLIVIGVVLSKESEVPTDVPSLLNMPSFQPGSHHSSQAVEIEKLWADNNKDQAMRALDQWMQKEKESPWPWVLAAELQFRQKLFKKCISLCDKALKKSPQCPEAYYWKGRSYEAMNNNLDAANEYRASLVLKQAFPEAEEALKRVEAMLGTPSETKN